MSSNLERLSYLKEIFLEQGDLDEVKKLEIMIELEETTVKLQNLEKQTEAVTGKIRNDKNFRLFPAFTFLNPNDK